MCTSNEHAKKKEVCGCFDVRASKSECRLYAKGSNVQSSSKDEQAYVSRSFESGRVGLG